MKNSEIDNVLRTRDKAVLEKEIYANIGSLLILSVLEIATAFAFCFLEAWLIQITWNRLLVSLTTPTILPLISFWVAFGFNFLFNLMFALKGHQAFNYIVNLRQKEHKSKTTSQKFNTIFQDVIAKLFLCGAYWIVLKVVLWMVK